MATKPVSIPIYLPPLFDEPIDCWLEAYAARLGVTVGDIWCYLLPTLPKQGVVSGLYARVDERALAHLAAVSRVAPEQLARTIPRYLQRKSTHFSYSASEIPPLARSRWCPHCLAERDGRWRAVWRHPLLFGCVNHGCFLLDLCKSCQKEPRRKISLRCIPSLGHCGVRGPARADSYGEICGVDLRNAHVDQMERRTVDHQHMILQLIKDADAGSHEATVRLRDLFIMVRALAGADIVADSVRLGTAIAEAMPFARPQSDPAPIREFALLDIGRRPGAFTTITSALSPAPRRIILAARDPYLSPALRLRHATVSTKPFADIDGDAERVSRRAARIPGLLWRGLTLSLVSPPHPSVDALRRLGPLALLLPGSSRPLSALCADAEGRFRSRGFHYAIAQ